MTTPLKAVVLAAGKGTRLRTEGVDLPKVLRQAAGRPLLSYVLDGLGFLPPEDIVLVVGYEGEKVISAFPGYPHAYQSPQLGTGHAVQCAEGQLKDFEGDILICCGDMPLMGREAYEKLWEQHVREGNCCTLMAGVADRPLPYGRILRDENGGFSHIVEDRDCTEEEKAITELNAGIYIFRSRDLWRSLTTLRPDNAQGEYYLTDAPEWLRQNGRQVGICKLSLGREIIGVNTPDQLAEVEETLNSRKH